MRAVTARWPLWIARQLLMPVWPLPLTVATRQGTKIHLRDDRIDDLVLLSVAARSTALYFPAEALSERSESKGVILDVGAHHGIYAVEALRRYPHCTVVAVEPDPESCRRMAANIQLNDLDARVRIVNAGVSRVPGRGQLEPDVSGSWGTQVREVSSEARETIPLLPLSDILRGESPVIVKCNAEGAEFALVPQLIELGLRPALIVLMVHPSFGSAAALVRDLEGAGYDVRDADDPPKHHRFHCTLPKEILDR
jgi:FkbM family methyltransferase